MKQNKGKFKTETELFYKKITNSDGIKDWGIPDKSVTNYDQEKKIINTYNYDADGNLSSINTYKYDDDKNIIEWYFTHPNRSKDELMDSKVTFKYDKKGRCIESNWYTDDKRIFSKDISIYDEMGNCVEMKSYNGDGSLSDRTVNKFDEKGKQIENDRYDSEGRLEYKSKNKYDEVGIVIETNQYTPDGILQSKNNYEYQDYDEKGNYRKFIWLENDIPIEIIEREIEYYS